MKLKGTFTSVWDDGTEVTTDAELETETGEVIAEMSDEDPDCTLEREFFTDEEDEEDEVCTVCHNFILKSVIKEGMGKTLYETEVCSDPYCESNEE
jgi:hypothetical protein